MNNSDEPTFNETPEETLARLRQEYESRYGLNDEHGLLDLMRYLQSMNNRLTEDEIERIVSDALEQIKRKHNESIFKRSMKGM